MTRSLLPLATLALLTSACPAASGSLDIVVPLGSAPVPGDDDDTETPPISQAAALCAPESSEPSDTPAIAFSVGSEFFIARADGTSERIHDFAASEDDSARVRSIVTAGGFSAVLGRSDAAGQFFATFDADGELIAEGFRNNTNLPYIHDMYLSDEGWLTAYTGSWSGFVVSPDGDYMELPGVVPTAAPFSAGRVSVVRGEWFDHERAWWTPQNGLEPLAFEPREFLLHRVGRHLVYSADVGDGDIQLVLEDGETVERIDVPDDAPRVESIETDRWILLGGPTRSGPSFRTLRVDTRTGTVEDLAAVLPEGFWTMRSGRLDVDAGGALLLPIRTDGAAGLFRSEHGVEWELVGEAVYGAMSLVNGNRGGAVLSRSVPNIGSSFVDEEYGDLDSSWTPIEGDHLQFIRPSDGQTWLLPAPPNGGFWDWNWAEETRPRHYVSMDGTCAAYWETDTREDVRLRLVHIDSGPVDAAVLPDTTAAGSQAGPIAFYSL